MLLKDCPVGSFVRLVSFDGHADWADRNWWWRGCFEVFSGEDGKYVVCNDGDKFEQGESDGYVFEIVTPSPKSEGRSKFNVGDRVVCIKHEVDAKIGREYTVTSDDAGYSFPAFRFLDDDGEESAYMNDDSFILAENSAPSTPITIAIDGKTYKLKPYTRPRLTVINGVTYEMEEI